MMLMRGFSFYFMSSFCILLPEVILTRTFMTWDTTVTTTAMRNNYVTWKSTESLYILYLYECGVGYNIFSYLEESVF